MQVFFGLFCRSLQSVSLFRSMQSLSQQKCDWAKYSSSHISRSIWVFKLILCQNGPPMGGSFWQNNSLISHILFELWLLEYLAQSHFCWDRLQVYLGLCRCSYVYLGLFRCMQCRCMQVYLGLFRSLYVYVGLSRSIQVYLGLFRSVWVYLGLFRSIQVYYIISIQYLGVFWCIQVYLGLLYLFR